MGCLKSESIRLHTYFSPSSSAVPRLRSSVRRCHPPIPYKVVERITDQAVFIPLQLRCSDLEDIGVYVPPSTQFRSPASTGQRARLRLRA